MSDKKTLDEEEEKLLDADMEDIANLLCELEEKMLSAGITLSDGEMKAMKTAQVKLAEHRVAEKAYIDKVIQAGIDDGELEAVSGGVISTDREKK